MRLSAQALLLLELREKDMLSFHDPDSLLGECYSWIMEQDVLELLNEPEEQHPIKETN
jgi:hypothetical protein